MVNNKFINNNYKNMPEWLINYKKGDIINFDDILKSKLLYYPGSGTDSHPIKVFNPMNILHTYLYIDYLLDKEYVLSKINDDFYKEYTLYDFKEFDIKDINFREYVSHFTPGERMKDFHNNLSYGILFVFEKNVEDKSIPNRFAIVYLNCDAITFYDKLFQNYKSLEALVIHDHGFGCAYDRFDADGPMYEIAKSINVYPKYILCTYSSRIWDYYEKLCDYNELPKGDSKRDLYIMKKENQSRRLTNEDKKRLHNYIRLHDYILSQNADGMRLSLSEIEEVIGHRLAQSYYDRNIWCYEDKPIYKVIVGAGYSVVERFYDEDYILIRRSN